MGYIRLIAAVCRPGRPERRAVPANGRNEGHGIDCRHRHGPNPAQTTAIVASRNNTRKSLQ